MTADPERRRRLDRWLPWAVALLAFLIAGNSVANTLAFRAIQSSRVESSRIACKQTNERHDAVIASLDDLINRMPPGSRQRRAIANRDSTEQLLDAIVPHRGDCQAYSEALVAGEKP